MIMMTTFCQTFWQSISNTFFTIIGACLTYCYQKKISKDDEQKRIFGFLISVKAEISGVWNRYYEEVGSHVENLQDHTGFDSYYPIFDRYFVVYDSNTNLLGELTQDLSELIVETYLLAKGLKDSFLFNNDLLAKTTYYHDLSQESRSEHYKIQHAYYVKMCQNYGVAIKEMHFRLKENQKDLISLINKQLKQK